MSTPTRGVRRVLVFLSNNTRRGVKNTRARSTAVSLFLSPLDAPYPLPPRIHPLPLESARRETHSQPLAYVHTNTPHSLLPTPATGHPQQRLAEAAWSECDGW